MHNVVRGCAEILPMLVGNFKSIETAVGLFFYAFLLEIVALTDKIGQQINLRN